MPYKINLNAGLETLGIYDKFWLPVYNTNIHKLDRYVLDTIVPMAVVEPILPCRFCYLDEGGDGRLRVRLQATRLGIAGVCVGNFKDKYYICLDGIACVEKQDSTISFTLGDSVYADVEGKAIKENLEQYEFNYGGIAVGEKENYVFVLLKKLRKNMNFLNNFSERVGELFHEDLGYGKQIFNLVLRGYFDSAQNKVIMTGNVTNNGNMFVRSGNILNTTVIDEHNIMLFLTESMFLVDGSMNFEDDFTPVYADLDNMNKLKLILPDNVSWADMDNKIFYLTFIGKGF